MLLLNVAVLFVLAITANGLDGWSDWSDWVDQEECNVLCGRGRKLQERVRECSGACEGEAMDQRNVTCNTEPCGDKCPQDEVTFIPHPTNPARFYQCANGRAWLQRCAGGGLVWNQDLRFCTWA